MVLAEAPTNVKGDLNVKTKKKMDMGPADEVKLCYNCYMNINK